jgi:hypothetical protein
MVAPAIGGPTGGACPDGLPAGPPGSGATYSSFQNSRLTGAYGLGSGSSAKEGRHERERPDHRRPGVPARREPAQHR